MSSQDDHPYDIYALHIRLYYVYRNKQFWVVLFSFYFQWSFQLFLGSLSKSTVHFLLKTYFIGGKFQIAQSWTTCLVSCALICQRLVLIIHLPFISMSSIYFYLYHIYTCPILIFFNIYTTWQNFLSNALQQKIRTFYIENIFILQHYKVFYNFQRLLTSFGRARTCRACSWLKCGDPASFFGSTVLSSPWRIQRTPFHPPPQDWPPWWQHLLYWLMRMTSHWRFSVNIHFYTNNTCDQNNEITVFNCAMLSKKKHLFLG